MEIPALERTVGVFGFVLAAKSQQGVVFLENSLLLAAELSAPGVYKFPDGSRLSTVIKLAVVLPAV